MVHSLGRDFEAWSEYAKAVREQLDRHSRWPLDLREHSLEIARSGDDNSEGPFVEYLRALFAKRQLDLIVSIGAPAAAFVQRHRQQLFPTTPMLLTVVDQRRVQYSVLTENDTVVAVAHSFPAVFESILQVLPDTKTMAVVNGNSTNERFWSEEIRRAERRFVNRLTFKWYNELSFEDILKDAAALPPHSAIFWHLMNVDAKGVAHEANSALSKLSSAANAPIFSYLDVFFGGSIVGGSMHSVQEGGAVAAEAASSVRRRISI
jgi:hypothetical protein